MTNSISNIYFGSLIGVPLLVAVIGIMPLGVLFRMLCYLHNQDGVLCYLEMGKKKKLQIAGPTNVQYYGSN